MAFEETDRESASQKKKKMGRCNVNSRKKYLVQKIRQNNGGTKANFPAQIKRRSHWLLFIDFIFNESSEEENRKSVCNGGWRLKNSRKGSQIRGRWRSVGGSVNVVICWKWGAERKKSYNRKSKTKSGGTWSGVKVKEKNGEENLYWKWKQLCYRRQQGTRGKIAKRVRQKHFGMGDGRREKHRKEKKSERRKAIKLNERNNFLLLTSKKEREKERWRSKSIMEF